MPGCRVAGLPTKTSPRSAGAERLGVDRSQAPCEALAQHLARRAAEADPEAFDAQPFTVEESVLDHGDERGLSRTGLIGWTGLIGGIVQRGAICLPAVPDGRERPVPVLTHDPVADRIVVAGITRTRRGVVSELVPTPAGDYPAPECFVSVESLNALPCSAFRRHLRHLRRARMARAGRTRRVAVAC